MKVGDFARLAGVSVDDVVTAVVGVSTVLGDFAGVRTEGQASVPESSIESVLAGLVGEATLSKVEAIVDRWLLGRVLDDCDGNVTHAARRLGTSRRHLRERWAAVRGADGPQPAERSRAATPADVPLPVPPLPALLARGGRLSEVHEAVARWLVACVLDREGHNVSKTAKVLGVSRRLVRRMRDELDKDPGTAELR